jgi:putative acetyltransferase
MNYLKFLSTLDQWVAATPAVSAAAMVGSYARRTHHKDSDIDIALLTDEPTMFTESTQWLSDVFAEVKDIRREQWGPVTAFRFWLDDLEVELNITPSFWARVPVDPGTANLVAGGMTIVKDDAGGTLQTLINAVADGLVVNIRTHLPGDAKPIADLFYRAVHAIDDDTYSAAQKSAWAPVNTEERLQYWYERIEMKRPFVAEYQDQVVGFIELEPNGLIDCLYIDPDFQNQGLAGQLYQQAVNEASHFGLKELTTFASKEARPFFERRGFNVDYENQVEKEGQTLTNYYMKKSLTQE